MFSRLEVKVELHDQMNQN